ncbi:unnamed protein product [Closterium sp. NIES-53]
MLRIAKLFRLSFNLLNTDAFLTLPCLRCPTRSALPVALPTCCLAHDRHAALLALCPTLHCACTLPCPAARAPPCPVARALPCSRSLAARTLPCPTTTATTATATVVAASGGGQQQQLLPETLSPQQLREWVIRRGRPGGGGYGAGGTGQQRYGAGGTGQQRQQCQQETLSPQQLHEWDSRQRVPGSAEATSLGAFEPGSIGAASVEALHTFTLDSGATPCFFHDCTTVTAHYTCPGLFG